MRKSFMIEFELPTVFGEEFLALIPQQRYMVNQMMAEGTIRNYSLSIDRSRLWMILNAESEFEVMEILTELPLSNHMIPDISELMFHNSGETVMQFSLN